MNPKWHKIKRFNVKTVVKTLSGPQTNKHSIKKKASTHHFAVKSVELKLERTSITVEDTVAESENLFQ